MAFLIADETLENLICNTCQKVLSVQPVKIYPNRKIKCGRCSEDGDAGVVSLFNLLADHCIFKCVNRFDGCRKLLTYSEVQEHELECVGKSYICPTCSVSTAVPTFLMISHFKKEHKNMYLDIPSFFIDVKEALQIVKIFLYKHYDRLFIVIFRLFEYVTISAMVLGDSEDARNITHRFTLCSPDFEVNYREKLCIVFDLSKVGASDIEKFKIPKHIEILYVKFRMNLVFADGIINIPVKYYSLGTEHTDGSDENCFKSRCIYLNDGFRETYSNFSIGLNFTSLMKDKHNEIVLSCSNCHHLDCSCFEDHSTSVYLHKKEQKYYFICYPCSKYVKNLIFSSHKMLEVKTFTDILFFCWWKCGKFFKMTLLNNHEINCSFQPIQKCPVNYCNYKNKLFDITHHLKDHSKEFSFTDTSNGSLYLPLLIEKTPIKKFVLVEHNFILMQFIWVQPQWNISIHKCTPSKKCDAVALILDKSYSLLSYLKENQTIKICHMENLIIKCYFKMKVGT